VEASTRVSKSKRVNDASLRPEMKDAPKGMPTGAMKREVEYVVTDRRLYGGRLHGPAADRPVHGLYAVLEATR